MIAYKLLNPNLTTYGGCQWVVGKKKTASGTGQLCGPGWLHGYEYAELAHFLNPVHANFKLPVLYRVEVGGRQLRDGVLKSGWTEMTLLEPVDSPVPTTEQRVRFAIACAVANYHHPHYINWATRWLNGDDRSSKAAWAAAKAEVAEAMWAREAWAAWASARAASGAAEAAEAEASAEASARAEAAAAWASARAAEAAAWAADDAEASAWAAKDAEAAAKAAEAAETAAKAEEAAETAARAAAWAAEDAEAAAARAAKAAVDDGTPIVQAVKFALSADLYPACLMGGNII